MLNYLSFNRLRVSNTTFSKIRAIHRPCRNVATADEATPISRLTSTENCVSKLNRSLFRITGQDAATFLNNLTTHKISLLHTGEKKALFTVMLNTQGRVLFDLFITKVSSEDEYLLDCEADMGQDVLKHMKKYKIRSKVTFDDMTDKLNVWSVFGKDATDLTVKSPLTMYADPRLKEMGMRIVLPKHESLDLSSSFTPVSESVYHLHRITRGIPEGKIDFPMGSSLPFEATLDYIDAVNFEKGCYLGQELTARTHYTGVIRKRLFPVVTTKKGAIQLPSTSSLFPPFVFQEDVISAPPSGIAVVTPNGKKTGNIYSTSYNVAMAMIRMEHLSPDIENSMLITEEFEQENERKAVHLKVLKPHWWEAYLKEKLALEEKISEKFLEQHAQEQ